MIYVQAYDIGETLATSNRGQYINQVLGKEASFQNNPARYSAAQIKGIQEGKIKVWPLEGIVEKLTLQKAEGSEIIAITQGTQEMAEGFLNCANLRQYIDRLYTTDKKTNRLFLSIFEELYSKNRIIENYHDDDLENIMEARKAADRIMEKYGFTFKTHLVGGKDD